MARLDHFSAAGRLATTAPGPVVEQVTAWAVEHGLPLHDAVLTLIRRGLECDAEEFR